MSQLNVFIELVFSLILISVCVRVWTGLRLTAGGWFPVLPVLCLSPSDENN